MNYFRDTNICKVVKWFVFMISQSQSRLQNERYGDCEHGGLWEIRDCDETQMCSFGKLIAYVAHLWVVFICITSVDPAFVILRFSDLDST